MLVQNKFFWVPFLCLFCCASFAEKQNISLLYDNELHGHLTGIITIKVIPGQIVYYLVYGNAMDEQRNSKTIQRIFGLA